MDQNCQKVLLVITHLGIQTYTSSTLPISIFYIKVSTVSFLPEVDFQFLNFFQCIPHRKWNLDTPEVAKVVLAQTNFEIPFHPSRKLQLGSLLSRSKLRLLYYLMTLALKNLWFLPFD